MTRVCHALGFLMHQPPDTLNTMVEHQMGRLLQIIDSYQMPLKYLNSYQDCLKIHVGFSGVLLEELLSREVIDACRKIIDIPSMLNGYRESKNVEIIGLGYSHPLFPLIPAVDWDAQIAQGREIAREVFGHEPRGFFPSAKGFCPQMIPILKKYGYEYVILDRSAVKPKVKEAVGSCCGHDRYSSIGSLLYRQTEIGAVFISNGFDHLRAGDSPTKLPEALPSRDGASLAAGQQDLLIVDWLVIDDLIGRKISSLPEDCEFWEGYFSPYLEWRYKSAIAPRSVLLRELVPEMKMRPPLTLQVENICIADFQENGHFASIGRCSPSERKRAIEEVWRLSQQYHEVRSALLQKADRCLSHGQVDLADLLERVQKWLLKSQTDCYFSEEDESWAAKVYDNIKPALILLKEVKRQVW